MGMPSSAQTGNTWSAGARSAASRVATLALYSRSVASKLAVHVRVSPGKDTPRPPGPPSSTPLSSSSAELRCCESAATTSWPGTRLVVASSTTALQPGS